MTHPYDHAKRLETMNLFIAHAARTGQIKKIARPYVANTYGVTVDEVNAAILTHSNELCAGGAK